MNFKLIFEYLIHTSQLSAPIDRWWEFVKVEVTREGTQIKDWRFPEPELTLAELAIIEASPEYQDYLLNRDKILERQAAEKLFDTDLRRFGLVVLEQHNVTAAWIIAYKAAVAAATSLADLKTRIAEIPNTPQQFTPEQLKNAMDLKDD